MISILARLYREIGQPQRSATGEIVQGADGCEVVATPDDARWLADQPPQVVAPASARFLVRSRTRRHFLAISVANYTWSNRWAGLEFDWAGGYPTTPIVLADLDGPPQSSVYSAIPKINGLTILTDRFDPGELRIGATAGMAIFIEGEEEADFLLRPTGADVASTTVVDPDIVLS